MKYPHLIPGASKDGAYWHILETAKIWARARRGDGWFRTRELRWLLAREGWQLHGDQTRDQADRGLAQAMGKIDEPAGQAVGRIRAYLDEIGLAPMPEALDCSQRAFVSYLAKLVDNRLLHREGKGVYRIHPFGPVRKVIETEGVPDRLLGEQGPAVGINLREGLTSQEEKVLDRIGEVLGHLARIASVIQAGPDPSILPEHLTKEMVIRVGPDPFEVDPGIEFALAIADHPDVEQALAFDGDEERYRTLLEEMRRPLDDLVDSLRRAGER